MMTLARNVFQGAKMQRSVLLDHIRGKVEPTHAVNQVSMRKTGQNTLRLSLSVSAKLPAVKIRSFAGRSEEVEEEKEEEEEEEEEEEKEEKEEKEEEEEKKKEEEEEKEEKEEEEEEEEKKKKKEEKEEKKPPPRTWVNKNFPKLKKVFKDAYKEIGGGNYIGKDQYGCKFAELKYVDLTEINELNDNNEKKKVPCTYYLKFSIAGRKKTFTVTQVTYQKVICTIK